MIKMTVSLYLGNNLSYVVFGDLVQEPKQTIYLPYKAIQSIIMLNLANK